ncbi:MAG: hypothetical protein JNK26_03620 [Candidatus Doudnabacteria bacterium]|nr:hypothetical protein [Candidatus Doudnabacteria bacterium]
MASAGLQQPLNLSPELTAIVGAGPLSRPQATKKLWDYIKANNLQNPANKKEVLPDEKLAKVLGSEPVHMLKIAGKLSPHFSK